MHPLPPPPFSSAGSPAGNRPPPGPPVPGKRNPKPLLGLHPPARGRVAPPQAPPAVTDLRVISPLGFFLPLGPHGLFRFFPFAPSV